MNIIEKNSIKSIFNSMSDDDIRKFIEDKYRKGYLKGRFDQKTITSKVKFRYSILLSWMVNQLEEFISVSENDEYVKTVDKIISASNEYIFENNLLSGVDSESIKQQALFLPRIVKKLKPLRNE